MTQRIKYHSEYDNSIDDDIFKWISVIIGIRLVKSSEEDCDIYYGNEHIHARLVIRRNENDIIWQNIEAIKEKPISSNVIEFDIINAIKCFLSDEVNSSLPKSIYDTHNRLKFEQSFQARNNISEYPIVNMYVKYFSDAISKFMGAQPTLIYPEEKKCAICLSHDVDKPMLFQFLRNFHLNRSWSISDCIYHIIRYIHNYSEYIFSNDKNGFADFNGIVDEESKRGFKSTFYFASSNGYSDWGAINDVFYDLNWAEFRPVIEYLQSKNFDIGLHASYNSYKDVTRMKFEKEKLETVLQSDVIGIRHHYWSLGGDLNKVFCSHSNAGFKYDSTVGFNDHIGYRRNVALPFYSIDLRAGEMSKSLQIPIVCMDGNLFYNRMPLDEALAMMKRYIKVIKELNGTAALDWHSETSYRQEGKFRNWAEAYMQILDWLVEDNEIWVTSPDEVYRHFSQRKKELNDR